MADETVPSGTTVTPPAGAGTPSGTPGEPAAGAAAGGETPEQVEARIRAEYDTKFEQQLREKQNLEDERKRREELERENEQLRQRSAYPPATGVDPATQQRQLLQQQFDSVAQRDPEAAQLIATMGALNEEANRQTRAEVRYYRELNAIADPADRIEAERRCKAQQGLSPAWALKEMKAERLDKTQKQIDDERRLLEDERRRLSQGTVKTTASPAPPQLKTDEMRRTDYARKMHELQEKGDIPGAQALKARKDKGELKLADD